MSDKTSDKNRQSIKTGDKLLNCPFCGGEAKMEEHFEQWDGRYYEVTHISCRLCGCSSNTISEMECKDRKKRKEEAIKAWNTRKPMERILERLKTLKQIELDREDACDEDGFGDGEEIFLDGVSQGRHEAFYEAIEIVKEEGGIE